MADVNAYETSIDDVPFQLKAPFDFSFLKKYGRVFKVLANQDSGNICFGVDNGNEKYFLKFAGAETVYSNISTEEAIANLRKSVDIFRDLAHPYLSRLINAEEIGGGFMAVFEWADAISMGRMYQAQHQQFMALPLSTRVKIFEDVLAFHAHVAAQGYVAIDFYDGSIMYSQASSKTIICDIDFYSKMPYVNEMGRLWGSSIFMSPEEFTKGAAIDEITNVFVMGKTAFALIAGYDNTLEKWPFDMPSYDVIKRAVSDKREERQQSITQLIEEWTTAKPTKV